MSTLESSRIYRTLSTATERLSAFVRGSYLYRWLTAEPDPEVIVIDLRETWTVGPFISILDRVFGTLERGATGSTLVGVGSTALDRTLEAPVRTAGLVALSLAALAVPAAIVLGRPVALLVGVGLLAVGTLALFERRSWQELGETRPVELLVAAFEPPESERNSDSQQREAPDDREAAQRDTDEPEGDALDDPHQGVDRDVADEGAGGERDERDER